MFTPTAQLDRLEDSLPPVPARIVRLQRSAAGAAYDQASEAFATLANAACRVLRTAGVSGRTVTGQARYAGSDVAATVRRDTKQVIGQARAQTRRVSDKAEREATQVLDEAIGAVSGADGTDGVPGSGTPYEQWTKAQLLARADQIGVEGRSRLNKPQLIAAIRRA